MSSGKTFPRYSLRRRQSEPSQERSVALSRSTAGTVRYESEDSPRCSPIRFIKSSSSIPTEAFVQEGWGISARHIFKNKASSGKYLITRYPQKKQKHSKRYSTVFAIYFSTAEW